ncbi:MAG: hypothetical protein Q8M24_02560 [Pseudolabrys sp.]|nr:hypothetical protein [Pseudolabrys sp.]MDP2294327.1 hypothetical protein [Pseudolabrys sp.]
MLETNETPRDVLIAAIFCAIIGIITYAGFLQGGFGNSNQPYALSNASKQ